MIRTASLEPQTGHGGKAITASVRSPRMSQMPAVAPLASVGLQPGVTVPAVADQAPRLAAAHEYGLGGAGAFPQRQVPLDELAVANDLHEADGARTL